MWRQTLSIMFDNLLGESEITNEVLYKIKENSKFGKRDLKFEELNKNNPNKPSLLKAVNLKTDTVLVPHYNGYVCRTSSSVYPRLTDKRSCLYYFGRIVAFCLIYSGKMPNFLHENFWKSLVGGRLYFDDEVTERYHDQIAQDPMFKINGTKPLSQLYYPLTPQQLDQYYHEYVEIWKMCARGQVTDVDFLGLPQQTLDEIASSNIDLRQPQILRRYAHRALLDMQSGQAFAKAYSEFRNGFRHPFATSMAMAVYQQELLTIAVAIDRCLDQISAGELEEILTFNPRDEEYMNRETVVQHLFQRNVQRIRLEQEAPEAQLAALEKIVQALLNKATVTHAQLLDLVFACTGARTVTGTEIFVHFDKPRPGDVQDGRPVKRFIQFHTCFNQMDVPLSYCSSLTPDEVAGYLNECVTLAL